MNLKIKNKQFLSDNVFLLSIEYNKKNILPGQFVDILIPDNSIILRRPFSIARVKDNTIELIIKELGSGTHYLSTLNKNDSIDILLPLGSGFDKQIDYENTLFIAGGIGIAGVSSFIDRNQKYRLLFGDKNGEYKDVLRHLELNAEYIKENEKGFVSNYLDKYNFNVIIACGPFGMFKSIREKINNKTFYAIAEQIMACGIGLCNGCIVEYNNGDFVKVCKDGPIIDGMRIKYD